MYKSRKRPLLRVIPLDRNSLNQFADDLLQRDKAVLDAYYEHHAAWSREYRDTSTSPRDETNDLFDFALRHPRECLERIPRQSSSLHEAVAALCLRDLTRRNVTADEALLEAVAGCVFLASVARRPSRVRDIVGSLVRLLRNTGSADETALKVLKAFLSVLADTPLYERVTILDKVLSALFDELDTLDSLRRDLCQSAEMPLSLQGILLNGASQPPLGMSLYAAPEGNELMDATIVCRIRETPATDIVKIINLLNALVSTEAAIYVIDQLHYIHDHHPHDAVFLKSAKKHLASIASQGAHDRVLQLICNAQPMDTAKGSKVFFGHFDRIVNRDTKRKALQAAILRTNKIVQVDILLDHLYKAELAEEDRRHLMAALAFACKEH